MDYHGFRSMSIKLDLATLSFLRESTYRIGRNVQDLSLLSREVDFSTTGASYPAKYLDKFYKELPHVDTLSVASNECRQMPWLRNVRTLRLRAYVFAIYSIFEMLYKAPKATSVLCHHYDVRDRNRIGLYSFRFDTPSPTPEDQSVVPAPWRRLSHYSINFESVGSSIESKFEEYSYLPKTTSLPALRSLRLVNLLPIHNRLLQRLTHSSAKSLKYIEIAFDHIESDREGRPHLTS